jgi:hypothetical protein
VYDGSLANRDALPCPPGVAYCLRVATTPAGTNLGSALIEGILSGNPEDQQASTSIIGEALSGLPNNILGTLTSFAPGDFGGLLSELGQFRQMASMLVGMDGEEEAATVKKAPVGADIWWVFERGLLRGRRRWCCLIEQGDRCLSWAAAVAFVLTTHLLVSTNHSSALQARPPPPSARQQHQVDELDAVPHREWPLNYEMSTILRCTTPLFARCPSVSQLTPTNQTNQPNQPGHPNRTPRAVRPSSTWAAPRRCPGPRRTAL